MRWVRSVLGACGSALLVAGLAVVPAQAQGSTETTVEEKAAIKGPTSFVVDTTASAIQLDLSAPTLLPLDVNVGIGYAGTNFNSQPLIKTNAAPLYLPLLASLGLLGGWSGVPDLVIGLLPGIVTGFPTFWGLPQLPLDQNGIAKTIEPIRDPFNSIWPKKEPVLGCETFYPSDVAQAECGGDAEDVMGFQVKSSGARTVVVGDPIDSSKLRTEASASVLGIKNVTKNGSIGFSADVAKASTAAKVENGVVKAGVSASVGEITIGGILKIAALESSVSGELGATKETAAVSERRCKIVGVSILGIPIEFGDGGIKLADAVKLPVSTNAAMKIANEALAKAGIIIGKAGEAAAPVTAPAGGASSGFDPGILKITPYPGVETKMAEDGTSLETNFGCLEIHYRVPVSGLDIKLNLARISLKMGAFIDPEFGSDNESFTPSPSAPSPAPANVGGTTDTGPVAQLVDLGDSGPVGDIGTEPIAEVDTPQTSSEKFLKESPKVLASTWGIKGGWFAPFVLLSLALPLLAYARRASFTRR